MMEFPEDFNQLELLNTHGHLIPRGASSLWTGSHENDEEDDEEEEEQHSEESYLQKEKALKDKPVELILWAAEHNRLTRAEGGSRPVTGHGLVVNCDTELQLLMRCSVPHSIIQFWRNSASTLLRLLSTVHTLLTADPLLVHCCDEDGYTPLHRAAYSGHADVCSALITAGSKVNPRTIDGWTPLHSSCRWSRVTVASFLLQHGAELNAQTNGGLTPLHLAASNTGSSKLDCAHTLELLLSQRHLKAALRSHSGETASEVARRSGPLHYLFEMVEDYVSVTPGT